MILTMMRVLKFALQDFWRNFWLSFATISILVLALFSVNILISLKAISDNIIEVVKNKVDINIELTAEADEAIVGNFMVFLKNNPQVADVEFISREQVFEDFKNKNSNNPYIQEALAELGENRFSNMLIIKANNTADYEGILNEINSSEYREAIKNNDFSDPQKIISFVEDVDQKTESFGFFIAGMFILISFLIVFNTIRVTIYTHKDEIGVMRLVGATNGFIRAPYIVTSIFYAIIAMLIKVILFYALLNFITPQLVTFFGEYGLDLVSYFNANFFMIFGLELLAIVLLNVLSSSFAVRRYLRT